MTRRGVFFARRVVGGLSLLALVAFVVLFAPRACGALYGPVDEQAGSSENAALNEEPGREDGRPGNGTAAGGSAPVPGSGDEKAEGDGGREDPAPPENDEATDTGTDGSQEDDVGDGGDEPVGSQARAPETAEKAGFSDMQDEAQDESVASFSVPATTVEVPAETAPVRLRQNTAETEFDETNMAGTDALIGRALRAAPAAARPPASAVDADISVAGSPATLAGVDPTAKSAATTPQERRPDRRLERSDLAPVATLEPAPDPAPDPALVTVPNPTPEFAREPAPETSRRDANEGRGAAASAAVAPRGNASETARDADTHEDRRGATRGSARARAAATSGGDASGRSAAYVGKDHRARTTTSARSKAILDEGQRSAEASACSRARMRTTAPDGTVSWSWSWSCVVVPQELGNLLSPLDGRGQDSRDPVSRGSTTVQAAVGRHGC